MSRLWTNFKDLGQKEIFFWHHHPHREDNIKKATVPNDANQSYPSAQVSAHCNCVIRKFIHGVCYKWCNNYDYSLNILRNLEYQWNRTLLLTFPPPLHLVHLNILWNLESQWNMTLLLTSPPPFISYTERAPCLWTSMCDNAIVVCNLEAQIMGQFA